MIKNIIILTLLLILSGILFLDFAPETSVVAPEVKQTGDYRRPVREGNCWRQFTANDSILVCH